MLLHTQYSLRLTLPDQLVMKHHVEEGAVYPQRAVVIHKTQLSEFVHKEIDPRPRRPDHFGQHFLTHMGESGLRFPLLSKICQ